MARTLEEKAAIREGLGEQLEIDERHAGDIPPSASYIVQLRGGKGYHYLIPPQEERGLPKVIEVKKAKGEEGKGKWEAVGAGMEKPIDPETIVRLVAEGPGRIIGKK